MRQGPFVPVLALVVLGQLPASAQVNPGDIGIFDGSTTPEMMLMNPMTGASQTFVPGCFGPANKLTMLWDPTSPFDFIVGTYGVIARLTVSGPSVVTCTVITTAVPQPAQMSWDPQGYLLVVERLNEEILRVHPVTGAVQTVIPAQVVPGQGTWDLWSGALHPTTGEWYLGGPGSIYRYANGAATLYYTVPGASYVGGIAFDVVTGELLATVWDTGQLLRFDAAGVPTDLVIPGFFNLPWAATPDINGDYLVGSYGNVHRVPRTGGPPVVVGSLTYTVAGMAVVGVDLGASFPFLTVSQAATGAPVLIENYNLQPGIEYYNLFSLDLCPGGPGTGSGPFGSCILTAQNVQFISNQISLPIGSPPFHFIAPSSFVTWGPFALGPMTVDAICIEVTGGAISATSPPVRLTVQ